MMTMVKTNDDILSARLYIFIDANYVLAHCINATMRMVQMCVQYMHFVPRSHFINKKANILCVSYEEYKMYNI